MLLRQPLLASIVSAYFFPQPSAFDVRCSLYQCTFSDTTLSTNIMEELDGQKIFVNVPKKSVHFRTSPSLNLSAGKNSVAPFDSGSSLYIAVPSRTPLKQRPRTTERLLKRNRRHASYALNKVCTVIVFILLIVVLITAVLSPFISRNLQLQEVSPFLINLTVPGKMPSSRIDPGEGPECVELEVLDVWNVTFPKLLTESAVRTVDVDRDGVMDVIIGFATGRLRGFFFVVI